MSAGLIPEASPSVDIVIVSYNHARFVETALRSALAQTYANCSVTLIDDASMDGTATLAESLRGAESLPFELVAHKRNEGLCATLNEAIMASMADFICFISADDWMAPDRIARQVERMVSVGPQCAVCYSDAFVVDESGDSVLRRYMESIPPSEGQVFHRLLEHNFIAAPSAMIRRSSLDAVGAYDTRISYEDYDMWLRLAKDHLFAYVPEALVYYRQVQNSLSSSLSAEKLSRARLDMLVKHWGYSEACNAIILCKAMRHLRGAGRGAKQSSSTSGLYAPLIDPSPHLRALATIAEFRVLRAVRRARLRPPFSGLRR